MAEFTPGPLTPHLDGFYITDAEGSVVCEINSVGIPRSTAYTHLFSAAPEMLEALKEIDDGYTRCPICRNKKSNGHDYNCLLGKSLAKAEGKET